jgi:lambda family phage portal protein
LHIFRKSYNKNDSPRTLYEKAVRGISKMIGLFSPKKGAQYLHYHNLMRGYDAATTVGPDANWSPFNETGDTQLKNDWQLAVSRSRDLDRNNPLVTDALRIGHAYTVGNALKPQAQIFKPNSREKDVEKIQIVESVYEGWSENCCLDGRDMVDFDRLTYRHLKIDGEFLAMIATDGKHPFKLQPIEPEQIDDTVDGPLNNNNYAIRGLEFNKYGKCVAFHIYDVHPNGFEMVKNTVRVPAERMFHVYQPGRITETRGICHFVSSILPLFDQNELSDSVLDLHRIAAAFGIYVTTPFPEDDTYGLGSRTRTTTEGTKNENYKTVKSAGFHYMPAGREVKGVSPEMPTNQFQGFNESYLRKGGKGFGMSYETFTGDLSNANFSTLKAGQNNERCLFRIDSDLIIRKIKRPVYRLFMDAEHLLGNLNFPAYFAKKALYQKARFTLPALPAPDPIKEETGDKVALANNSTSLHRICERKGIDYDEIILERVQEAEDAMKIKQAAGEEL